MTGGRLSVKAPEHQSTKSEKWCRLMSVSKYSALFSWLKVSEIWDFLGCSVAGPPCFQCREPRFNPWSEN